MRKREEYVTSKKRRLSQLACRDRMKSRARANLGGRCVGFPDPCPCGDVDPLILQLDHIVPDRACRRGGEAEAEWARASRGDTENLQLLCPNCHSTKTLDEVRRERDA